MNLTLSQDDPTALVCLATIAAPETAAAEIMYMPAGVQTITPSQGGKRVVVQVLVDRQSAVALETQRAAIAARNGKRPYFDFNHEDRAASFWPSAFYWKDGPVPGVYARGEWSKSGREGIEGKDWRQFSPIFHVDDPQAKPARIVSQPAAKPNMGGFVNDPAFHQISPLWARDAAGAHPDDTQPNQPTKMTPEELAALQAKQKEQETELNALKTQQAALKAKNESDALVAAEIKAKEAEIKANAAELEVARLKAKNSTLETAETTRREQDADAAVAAAVSRGAIAAKDEETKKAWKGLIVANPANAALLAKQVGHPAITTGRITPPAVKVGANGGSPGTGATARASVTQEAVSTVLREYGAILARNAALPLSNQTYEEKDALAREAAALFAAEIADNAVILGMPMREALQAADVTDPGRNLGLLSGTLVLQNTLSRMQYAFPQLASVFTDFSAEPGLYGQTQVSRIVLTPAVQTYNTAADASGRPLGWTNASPAQTVDVPITLDEYVGIPIVFGNTTLASTGRNLFGEIANQALYALGGYFVRKMCALATPANFNAYAANTVGGGATTAGSQGITVASTAGLYPGQLVAGAGIPANSFVLTVTSGTTATLNNPATATATGLTFTLGSGKVPTTYASYVKALASFAMASLAEIGAAFDNNEVPQTDRSVMLNASYYSELSQDPSFNTYFAAMRSPEIISKGLLPEIQGFTPMKAPYFPTSGNRVGFAYHKAAIALKSRLPMDVTSALGVAAPGSVSTITDPATGLSLLLVQRVDLGGMYAEWRPEVMLGAAVGERRAGLVITSA